MTGKQAETTWQVPAAPAMLAWRGDGRLLAVASGTTVSVRDVNDAGRVVSAAEGHEGSLRGLAWDAGGEMLVTSSWDSTVRFWNPYNGKQILALSGNPVNGLCVGEQNVPVQHQAGKAALWELSRGQVLRALHGFPGKKQGVFGVAFSPDSRRLASAGRGGVLVWDSATGRLLSERPAEATAGRTVSVLFPLGQGHLLSLSTQGLRRWAVEDVADRTRLRSEQSTPLNHDDAPNSRLTLGGAGRLCVVGRNTDSCLLFDADDLTKPPRRYPTFGIWDAAVSPDGRWLATATYEGGARSGVVRVWDLQADRLVEEWRHEARSRVGFSPDGEWLVTADAKAYRFWRTGTWQPREWHLPCAGDNVWGAGHFAFAADGGHLAVAHSLRKAVLVDARTGRILAALTSDEEKLIHGFAFSPDGRRLAIAREDDVLHLWDLHALRGELARTGLDWKTEP